MSEDLEGGAQEVDEVHEVPRGPTVRLGHAPLVVRQLDELVNLLVQFGVDLTLGGVASILNNTPGRQVQTLQNTGRGLVAATLGGTSASLYISK